MNCKIYVTDFSKNKKITLETISNVLRVQNYNNLYISNDCLTVHLDENDSYDEIEQKIFPDGFLYFENLIELEFDNCEKVYQVSIINTLLEYLWLEKYSAIASTRIEEFLIKKGGYNCESIFYLSKG